MANLFRWDGKKWVGSGVGSFFKRWDGKKWVNSVVKRWNGKSWETISQQTYTKDFPVTWTRSYGGQGQYKGDWLESDNRLYQGRYGNPDIQWEGDWGIQKSMAGFNIPNLIKELEGAKIESVQLYIHNMHWWYSAGGRLSVGAHNVTNPPSKFSESRYNMAWADWNRRGGDRWVTLPKIFAEDLRDGKSKGFTLHRATQDLYYYGYFYGAGHGSRSPKLRITYTK